jgi:hypothetical protein
MLSSILACWRWRLLLLLSSPSCLLVVRYTVVAANSGFPAILLRTEWRVAKCRPNQHAHVLVRVLRPVAFFFTSYVISTIFLLYDELCSQGINLLRYNLRTLQTHTFEKHYTHCHYQIYNPTAPLSKLQLLVKSDISSCDLAS